MYYNKLLLCGTGLQWTGHRLAPIRPLRPHSKLRRYASPQFVVGGVFDRIGPEIVQYNCDSVLSQGHLASTFDSETGAQPFGAD
jgi:hypothetical protein